MSDGAVLKRLERSLNAENFSAKIKQQGLHLLERLSSPVRVVVLGLSGSGKKQILNILAGQVVVPENVDLSSFEMVWAEESGTSFTSESGDTQVQKGEFVGMPSDFEPGFTSFELTIPVLNKMSLLCASVSGLESDKKNNIDWAIQRADIVLWCSQEFSQTERDLWAGVPDEIKDHSFFVLTRVDELSSQNELTARISELEDVVAEEFHSLIPVASLQAIGALETDGAPDQELLAASGGKALIDNVLRQVEQGRRADMDSVTLFLSRHNVAVENTQQNTSDTSEQLDSSEKSDQTEISDQSDKITILQSATGIISGVSAPSPNKEDDFTRSVLECLRGRAIDLTRSFGHPDTEEMAAVLDHCATTANDLADICEGADCSGEEMTNLRDDILEFVELMQLIQVEEGDGPAADAVTLLLQLRRDLEFRTAA